MDRDEMRQILEQIARESPNPTARVSAIRALKQLADDEEEKKPDLQPGFEELDKAKPRRNEEGVVLYGDWKPRGQKGA
jgi:hypothetical protein